VILFFKNAKINSMTLKILNSESKKLEEFKPLNKNKVNFYQCGPTLY